MARKKLECLRCGNKWNPIVKDPKRCPRCISPYWNRPRLVELDRKRRAAGELPPDEGFIPPKGMSLSRDSVLPEGNGADTGKPNEIGRQINEILGVIRTKNPTVSFGDPFGRRWIEKLINTVGFKAAIEGARRSLEAMEDSHGPVATTPKDLYTKFGSIGAWSRKNSKPAGVRI